MTVNLVAILGPTACGKTALGVRLAREIGGEILSADSRQVYRGLDLGTGKDLDEYRSEAGVVPCHLIDIVAPDDEFHVFAYQRLFFQRFDEIRNRGAFPILVGGSGLYLEAVLMNYPFEEVPPNEALRAVLSGLDNGQLSERLRRSRPDLHNTTDLVDRDRLIRAIEIAEHAPSGPLDSGYRPTDLNPLVIGIAMEVDALRERIARRLSQRLEAGLVAEVRRLHDDGLSWESIDRFGLEYRYVARFLQGRINADRLYEELNTRIHQFAKRQRTWFRRMERRGIRIHWIPGDDYPALRKLVLAHLEGMTVGNKG
ncbi:MAG: tRNA (adenosine(37)-N6)-dimethylallyltransferase MiaA [Syntrophales bacterium]|jgi:tRNA dimethylallyltransferase|nr:tRNA (adenosine(37)-N6)-dimethylallyltransferase MiaA [Syntrophales bacterium]MDD4339136.1 tRNA (adenosine(37)-N6)-dimethylallyltransferase MiaA [Syntrophales bacterium]HOS77302.1 tRNA (adenosine(37)-N6)-dimethylallyltransferase MiaA [Syntrophales bacterium]HPB70074.1 tRNA (adenosine(37)-N6)-dimethylallyltransferase MiaA [Syntrophales bacterium]HQN26411.1 tRNA (adenosine(37)-N6)-dimethylallyltransferase MiaA [Syntrophales bacterium]